MLEECTCHLSLLFFNICNESSACPLFWYSVIEASIQLNMFLVFYHLFNLAKILFDGFGGKYMRLKDQINSALISQFYTVNNFNRNVHFVFKIIGVFIYARE